MRVSPFIIAMSGAVLVLLADIAWLAGELLTQYGIITMVAYTTLRCIILLGLCIGTILALISIYKYFKNGYVRSDKLCELNHLREECKSKGRRRIFCEK